MGWVGRKRSLRVPSSGSGSDPARASSGSGRHPCSSPSDFPRSGTRLRFRLDFSASPTGFRSQSPAAVPLSPGWTAGLPAAVPAGGLWRPDCVPPTPIKLPGQPCRPVPALPQRGREVLGQPSGLWPGPSAQPQPVAPRLCPLSSVCTLRGLNNL